MTQSTIAKQYRVTEEQISKAHRIVTLPVRTVFYQVESQSVEGVEYTVRYDHAHRSLTCTCPAGNPDLDSNGFPLWIPRGCWHLRAACAHAAEYRAMLIEEQERDMAELSAEIDAEARAHADTEEACTCSGLLVNGALADAATLARVANAAPQVATEYEQEQIDTLNENRTFRFMR
jgi:hypothetical protein